MSEPVYVTKVAERKWDWPWRNVVLPIFESMPERFSQEYFEWEKRNGWRYNFSVYKDDLQEAKMLAGVLWNLQKKQGLKRRIQDNGAANENQDQRLQ